MRAGARWAHSQRRTGLDFKPPRFRAFVSLDTVKKPQLLDLYKNWPTMLENEVEVDDY